MNLLIYRGSVGQSQSTFVVVELILCLLRHRERSGDCDLNHPVCIGTQELEVANLDRVFTADVADDSWYRDWTAATSEPSTRIVDLQPLECSSKTVRITLS